MEGRRKLTKRQEELLSYIKAYKSEYSRSPSLEEIGDNFSIAASSVHDHLKALEKKGYIQRDNTARSILLLEEDEPKLRCININYYKKDGSCTKLTLSNLILDEGYEYFAIQAPNESMINAGILPDDTLIFRKEKKAKENDIILCKVESTDEVLIRRYQIQAGRILLTNINIDSNLTVPRLSGIKVTAKSLFEHYNLLSFIDPFSIVLYE